MNYKAGKNKLERKDFNNRCSVLNLGEGYCLYSLFSIDKFEKIQEIELNHDNEISENEYLKRAKYLESHILIKNGNRYYDCEDSESIGSYITHSCEPNSIISISNDKININSIKEIGEFEKITVDFGRFGTEIGNYEPETKCTCGSDLCRGVINFYGEEKLHNNLLLIGDKIKVIGDIEKGEILGHIVGRRLDGKKNIKTFSRKRSNGGNQKVIYYKGNDPLYVDYERNTFRMLLDETEENEKNVYFTKGTNDFYGFNVKSKRDLKEGEFLYF